MNYKRYISEMSGMGQMFSAPGPDTETYGTFDPDPHGKEKCEECIEENEAQGRFKEFAQARLGGADTISTTSKEKGGHAVLTHHHFDVKLPYYEKAAKGEFDVEKATRELGIHVKNLTDRIGSIEQEDFQKLVGVIEVLGELIIKHTELMALTEGTDNPCWKGYEMVGFKDKGGKQVPNCVPLKEAVTARTAQWNGMQVEIGRIYDDPRIRAFAPVNESVDPEGEVCEYDVENREDIHDFSKHMREYKDPLNEAEYQGRKVKLGKPFRTPDGPKKFSVYVRNPKGNVVKVNFGDPDMKIKKNNPERRKSFRARHNCDSPGPRHKARYWSCRKW